MIANEVWVGEQRSLVSFSAVSVSVEMRDIWRVIHVTSRSRLFAKNDNIM